MSSMLVCAVGSLMVMLLLMTSSTKASQLDNARSSLYNVRRDDLEDLNQILNSLVVHMDRLRKRSCNIGMASNSCNLATLQKMMRHREFLKSGASPGKRSMGNAVEGQGQQVFPQDIVDQARALQDGLAEQKQIIRRLQHSLMQELRDSTQPEQDDFRTVSKRSCRLRLGGQCLTAEMDRAAAQYYYLKSPDSPGKRSRRSVAMETAAIDGGLARERRDLDAQSEALVNRETKSTADFVDDNTAERNRR